METDPFHKKLVLFFSEVLETLSLWKLNKNTFLCNVGLFLPNDSILYCRFETMKDIFVSVTIANAKHIPMQSLKTNKLCLIIDFVFSKTIEALMMTS